MFDVQELFAQVTRLKQQGPCICNNFLSLPALTEFSGQESSRLAYNEEAVALLCEDVGVTRLHFYLSSPEAAPSLAELLQQDSRRPVVADCVGKREQVEAVSRLLCKAGFEPYTRMLRLRGGKAPFVPVPEGLVQPACPEDADRILEMLQETFDPYVSHLPSRKKLLDLIGDRLVYCIRKDGAVAAVECLERIGRHGIYIYQGVVETKYRGSGFGGILLQHCLNQYRHSLTFTTWVEEGNEGPLRRHRQNGMTFDGLQDAILIYR